MNNAKDSTIMIWWFQLSIMNQSKKYQSIYIQKNYLEILSYDIFKNYKLLYTIIIDFALNISFILFVLLLNWYYNSLKIFIYINNLIRYICNNTWTKVKGTLWYAVISLYVILRCPRKSLRIYIQYNRNTCT